MSAQDGWTTSPTATSDLQAPRWGVSSSAKLLTRPSRHAASQSTTNFEQTLRPFEQTISPFEQTMRPSQQPRQSPQTQKPTRPSQQQSRPSQPRSQSQEPPRSSQQASRPRQEPSRQSQQIPDQRVNSLGRSLGLSRLAPNHRAGSDQEVQPCRQSPQASRTSQQARFNSSERSLGPSRAALNRSQAEQPRRQSHQIPDSRVSSFERSLRRSVRPASSEQDGRAHKVDQPRRQSQQIPDSRVNSFERSIRPSKPIANHRASSSPVVQPPQSAQQIPMDFPHLQRHRSDKSAGSSSSNSSSEALIELSPVRRREIISRVNETVQNVMASMLSDSSSNVQWKPKLRKKDISYYMDESTVKPGQTRFCCVSHTHATVDEVMKLFVLSDTESVLRNNRVLSDSLLENRVLSVLRRPTRERPMNSMYVRYSSYQTPGILSNREVCVAVATDMIRQPDGSSIGYCLWDSVDDPEFAESTKKPGLESCTMFRSGFFLRRSGRRQSSTDDSNQGYTKIVYMVGLEPGGWAPGLAARLLMEKFGANLGRLCSHFRRKQLDSRTFVMKTQWTSKMSAKSCKQCDKPFQVLSSRVNCHACGHVVCRSCTSKELVELHAVGLVPMHICFSCLGKAGLPAPASSQKTRSSLRRRRLQSDTTTISRTTAQEQAQPLSQSQPLQQSKSVVDSDFIKEEDDDDTDTGEWAFTPAGVPVRPYRMPS